MARERTGVGQKVDVTMYGVKLGKTTYGAKNASTTFRIGRQLIAISDNRTHLTKVYIDGIEVANPLLLTQITPELVERVTGLAFTAALRRSQTTAAGGQAASRSARSLARNCSLQGSATYPWRKQATIAVTQSGWFPTSVSTVSPRRTSSACRCVASARAACATAFHPTTASPPPTLSRRTPMSRHKK